MLPGKERRKRLVPMVNTTRRKISDSKDLLESSTSIHDESSKSSNKPSSPPKLLSPRQSFTSQSNSRIIEIASLLQQASRMTVNASSLHTNQEILSHECRIGQNVNTSRQEMKNASSVQTLSMQNVNSPSPKLKSQTQKIHSPKPVSSMEKVNIMSPKSTSQIQKVNITSPKPTPQIRKLNIPLPTLIPPVQKVNVASPTLPQIPKMSIASPKPVLQFQKGNIPSPMVQIHKVNIASPKPALQTLKGSIPSPMITQNQKTKFKGQINLLQNSTEEFKVNPPLKCYTPARKAVSPAVNQILILNQYLNKDQSSPEVSRYQLNTAESHEKIQVEPVELYKTYPQRKSVSQENNNLHQNTFSPAHKQQQLVNQQNKDNIQVEALNIQHDNQISPGKSITVSKQIKDCSPRKINIINENNAIPSLKCYARSKKIFSPTFPLQSRLSENGQPSSVKYVDKPVSVISNIQHGYLEQSQLINNSRVETNIPINTMPKETKNNSVNSTENANKIVIVSNCDKNNLNSVNNNSISNDIAEDVNKTEPQKDKLDVKKISDKDTKIFILSPADLKKMGINLNTLQERNTNKRESRSNVRKQKEVKTKTKQQSDHMDVKKTLHAKISKKQNNTKVDEVIKTTPDSSISVQSRENEFVETSRSVNSPEKSLNMETAACITNYLIFSPKEGIANYIEGYNRAIQNTSKKQEESNQTQFINTEISKKDLANKHVVLMPLCDEDTPVDELDMISVIDAQSKSCETVVHSTPIVLDEPSNKFLQEMIDNEPSSVMSSVISQISEEFSGLHEPVNAYISSIEQNASSDSDYSKINENFSNSHQTTNNDNSTSSIVNDCSQINQESSDLDEKNNIDDSSINIFDCIQTNNESLEVGKTNVGSLESSNVDLSSEEHVSSINDSSKDCEKTIMSSLVKLITPEITEETLKFCEENVYSEPSLECNKLQTSLISEDVSDQNLNDVDIEDDNNTVNDISFDLVDINSDDDVHSFDITEDLGEQCLENLNSGVIVVTQNEVEKSNMNQEYVDQLSLETYNPEDNATSQDSQHLDKCQSNIAITQNNSENILVSTSLSQRIINKIDSDHITMKGKCDNSSTNESYLNTQTESGNENTSLENNIKDFTNSYRNIEILFKSLSKSIIVSENGELLPVTENEVDANSVRTEPQIEDDLQTSSTNQQQSVKYNEQNVVSSDLQEKHFTEEKVNFKNRKRKNSEEDDSNSLEVSSNEEFEIFPPLSKKRGRKNKMKSESSDDTNEILEISPPPPKKRGRNKKIISESLNETTRTIQISPPPSKKRGRKSKKFLPSSLDEENEVIETSPLPLKKRKRKVAALESSDEETPLSHIKSSDVTLDESEIIAESSTDQSQTKSTENITETVVSDLKKGEVKCGVCSQVMKANSWNKHSLNIHYYLAWIEGEPKPDLTSQSISVALLNKALKILKKFSCSRCSIKKASAVGYLTHINTCQKTPEEIEAYKLLCPICNTRVFPSTFPYHISKHSQDKVPVQKEKDIVVISETKSKRKAASAAEDMFKKMETDAVTENYDSLYSRGYLPKSSKRMDTIWKNKLKSDKKISCSRKSCVFECDSIDVMHQHYLETCEFIQKRPFKCKVCKHECTNEDTMIEHIKSQHSGLDKRHDEYVAGTDESDVPSDDSDSEVLSETQVKVHHRSRTITASVVAKQSVSDPCTKLSLDGPFRFSFDEPRDKEAKLRKINISSLKSLISKLYSCRNLFPQYQCNSFDVVHEDVVDSYLPEHRESCNISHICESAESVYEVVWSKYKLFQSEVNNGVQTFWCGGSVHAVDYLPSSYEKAYVAVATTKNLNDRYSEAEIYSHNGLIQIWDLGSLDNKIQQCLSPAVMVMGLAHEYGAVWDLSWCPSGCDDYNLDGSSTSNRMGLLAIACSDGNAYIYAICHPDTLLSDVKIWKTDPVIALCVTSKDSEESMTDRPKYQATKVCWSQDGVFNIIAVGYSNGIVAYYNINTKSPLLTRMCGNTKYISPYKLFQAHPCGITGLILMPNFVNSQDAPLAVSSHHGSNIWRGDHLTYSRSGNYSGLALPLIFPEVISFTEQMGPTYCRSNPIPLALTNGLDTRWSIYDENCNIGCVMDWTSTLYSASYHGQVTRRPYRSPFISRHRCNKSGIKTKILCWYTHAVKLNTESVDLSKIRTSKKSNDPKRRKSVDPNIPASLSSYDETSGEYGLLVVDVNTNCRFRGNITINIENFRMWPLWEQLCIKTCTINENYSNFAISGSRAGFCRNVYVPQIIVKH